MPVWIEKAPLVTDSIEPEELVEKGYLEVAVQKAISCGFDPVSAIQMATLNVAEHFGLDDVIGGIAPGRCADILVLPDVKTIGPRPSSATAALFSKTQSSLCGPKTSLSRLVPAKHPAPKAYGTIGFRDSCR